MQYRNHLPCRPRLPVPPESDMICSPAEVKYHRRVELKDHNASADTKKHFEELCSQFPKVFSTNNKDIGWLRFWKEQASSPGVFLHGPTLSSWPQRSHHQVNLQGEGCVLISMQSMPYNLQWLKQKQT